MRKLHKKVLIFVAVLSAVLLFVTWFLDYAYAHRDDVTVGPQSSGNSDDYALTRGLLVDRECHRCLP